MNKYKLLLQSLYNHYCRYCYFTWKSYQRWHL